MRAAGRHLLMTADAAGGVWQYATDLAEALVPHGWRATLLVTGPAPSDAQRADAQARGLAVRTTTLPLDWTAPRAEDVAEAGAAIARLAREGGADLLQLNSPAYAAGNRFAMPVVAVAHSCVASWWRAQYDAPLPDDLAWRADLTAQGLARADAMVTPSGAFADALVEAHALPRAPVAIHNGRSPRAVPARAMHDCAFTAGRLWDRAKNIATLDAVAGRLSIPFHAAGSTRAPHGETVTPRHLVLMDQLDDARIARRLASRPVFVSAARYEPFGLAVLEAAQAGCALVLSDIPTFRELWDGAATFVAPSDADGFVAAIEALTGDPARRVAVGEAARERSARYTVAATAAAMAALFERLAPARRVAA
jgi:hypothetical protein